MKKKVIIGISLALLGLTAFFFAAVTVFRSFTQKPVKQQVKNEEIDLSLPEADPAIKVTAMRSKTKDNAVDLSATGLSGKVSFVAYEMTYESGGLVKGVNSGSKLIETSGKDNFSREVYLGTCSKNVCKPDGGVRAVSVVMEFTDASGKKSQFLKDFPL